MKYFWNGTNNLIENDQRNNEAGGLTPYQVLRIQPVVVVRNTEKPEPFRNQGLK